MKRAVAFLLAVSMLLCLAGCSSFTLGMSSGTNLVSTRDYNSGIRKFIQEIEGSNYSNAISEYSGNIYGNATLESQATQFLYDYLSAALAAFNAETMSESEFDGILLTVQKVDNSLNIAPGLLDNVGAEYSSLADSKENYQSGVTSLKNGDYLSAVTCFNSVYVNDTNYTAAQNYLQEALQSYQQEVVTSVKAKMEAGEYETAVGILETASEYTGWVSEYEELAKQAVTLAAEKAVSDALDAGDYPTAQSAYDYYTTNASDYVQYSVEMISRLETAKTEYRQSAIQNAQQLAAENNYTEASNVLDNALLVLAEDSALLKAKEDIEAAYEDYLLRTTPVSLASLSAYKTDGWQDWCDDGSKDIFGNVYDTYGYGLGEYTYRINGIYKTFSGTIYTKSTIADYKGSIKIYGDGVQLYSATIQGGDDPINVSINITGVRDLTVDMDCSTGSYCRLGNPTLTP